MAAGNATYLGIDIGGTKCALVVGDGSGRTLGKAQFPTQAQRGPEAVIAQIVEQARQLREQFQDRNESFRSVGVCVGGPLDAARGIVFSPPNLPGWDGIELRKILEQRIHLPVSIEHDAAACALAEFLWGGAVGAERLIYLTCGTGFGAGFVMDGKIYRGARGRNMELGHARYREDGPDVYGKRGSMEGFCAAGSLSKLARWLYPSVWPNPPQPAEVARLAAPGDAAAAAAIKVNAMAVGDVCAMLGDLLRPDLIVLGSLAGYLGSDWVAMVRDRFVAEVLPETSAFCRITGSSLGNRLQECAALAVAVHAGQTGEP